MRRPPARNTVVSFFNSRSQSIKDFEDLAIHKFGMPEDAPRESKDAYLRYLGEALTTTCSPVVWPPESWSEFFECRKANRKR